MSYSKSPTLRYVSGAVLSLVLLATPIEVLAHGGGGGEDFGGGASPANGPVKVDAATANRLGIKVEPVTRQRLAVGIKTTGQIETLPNQQVEVTAPIDGTVVELLVKPGDQVAKGQAVAVLSSPELAQLRVDSVQKRADADPNLQQALADLRLAQQNYERQQTLATADIRQAQSQVNYAQDRYSKYKYLADAGAIERLLANENASKLVEAQAALTKAENRLPVLEAQAQLKRALAAVEAAQSRVRLSSAAYEARLQQLGNRANAKGLVTVTAPISGTVADRKITLGETISLQAGSKPLMTILNDNQIFATANIYEKDLNQLQIGQAIRVTVASLPNRTFTGHITLIGSVVTADTRVVPVKAELDNSSGLLKPGMFAQLEVLTARIPTAVLAIPSTAVVDANGKKIVYVQNGDAYQPTEVTLAQKSGDLVEVKTGLFEGDRLVTQRATELYAQSLRGGIPQADPDGGADAPAVKKDAKPSSTTSLPWWLALPVGSAVALSFWAGRRTKPQTWVQSKADYPVNGVNPLAQPSGLHNNNHHLPGEPIESQHETKRPH